MYKKLLRRAKAAKSVVIENTVLEDSKCTYMYGVD